MRGRAAGGLAGLLWALACPAPAADEPPAEPVPALTADSKWSLLVPAEARVIYRGVASFDGAGSELGPMMYPAPSAGGFLAAVITHGLLVDSAKKAEKERLQEAADRVLEPYRPVLDGIGYAALMRDALGRSARPGNASLVADAGQAVGDAVVESLPVFAMTQDQRALILDHTLFVRAPAAAADAGYRKRVRVVSQARDEADPAAYWSADGGRNLREESVRLMAQSIDIALRDAPSAQDAAAPQRTVRYREGGGEKIERAQVIEARCGRLLIRNLRGVMMSVPASGKAAVAQGEADCGR